MEGNGLPINNVNSKLLSWANFSRSMTTNSSTREVRARSTESLRIVFSHLKVLRGARSRAFRFGREKFCRPSGSDSSGYGRQNETKMNHDSTLGQASLNYNGQFRRWLWPFVGSCVP